MLDVENPKNVNGGTASPNAARSAIYDHSINLINWFKKKLGMDAKKRTQLKKPLGYDAKKGQAIVKEAATYDGTPYDRSKQPPVKGVGGDCSGTTEQILKDAVDPNFHRGNTPNGSGAEAVANSPNLVKVPGGLAEAKPGDILYWEKNKNGPFHNAIFVGDGSYNGKSVSDLIWTARSGTKPYSEMPASTFRKNDPPFLVLRDKNVAGE